MQTKIILIIFLNTILLYSQTFKEIYKENAPACVRIYSSIPDPIVGDLGGCGSGFIIDSSGIIVTNHHVIDGAKEIIVELDNGEEFFAQGYYVVDESLDFAILKIPGIDLPTVNLGNSNNIEKLDEVLGIGNPLCDPDSKNQPNKGDVNDIYIQSGVKWIKHDAEISAGNSGGPLFNTKGEVIGVNTASFDDGQNLNLAVPINYIRGYLNPPLINLKYNIDYDYIHDPWDRHYHSSHTEWCMYYELTEEQCACVLNTKKENFEHYTSIEWTSDFTEQIDINCFNKNISDNNQDDNSDENLDSHNSNYEYIDYGCVIGDCENGWSKFIYDGDFEGDTYEGEYKDGKRNGYGTYAWSGDWTGQIFQGEWKDWDKHGYGVLSYRGGEIDAGIWNDNEFIESLPLIDVIYHLNNKYSTSISGCMKGDCDNEWSILIYGKGDYHGDIYEGQYKNGVRTGYGTYSFSREWIGEKFEGEWKDWTQHGYGIATYKNGEIQSGIWNNGEFAKSLSINEVEVYLEKNYSNFINIDKCIKGDCINGYGVYKFSDGAVYEGHFKNQDFYGSGKYISVGDHKGDIYEGEYKNGKKNGYGTYTYRSGDIYEGEWENSVNHGLGIYIWSGEWEGQIYLGEHDNDIYNGYGILTYRNGEIESGIWEDDEFTRSLPNEEIINHLIKNYPKTSQNLLKKYKEEIAKYIKYNYDSSEKIQYNTWSELEDVYIQTCIADEYGDNNYCTNSWLCTKTYLEEKFSLVIQIDFEDDDYFDFIETKCFPDSFDQENNSTDDFTSDEIENDIKDYLNKNLDDLDGIEGIWTTNGRILDENKNILQESTAYAKCGIIKNIDNDFPYDFYEYIISADDFYPGESTATFNKTNKSNVYFSRQKDSDGDYEDTKFTLLNNVLKTSKKIEEDNQIFIYEQDYIKMFPLNVNTNSNNYVTDGCDLPLNNLYLNNGSVLFNSDSDIGGFQLKISGTTTTAASGGAAADANFTVQAAGSTVLGYSFTGEVIPAGCGTLTNLTLSSQATGLPGIVISDYSGQALDFEYSEGSDDGGETTGGGDITMPTKSLTSTKNELKSSTISNQNEVLGRWFIEPNDIKILLSDFKKNNSPERYNKISDKINDNYILELYEGYIKSDNPNGKILIYIYDYNKNVVLKFEEIWEIDNNNLKISNHYIKPLEFSHFDKNYLYFKIKNGKLIRFYK